MEGCARPPGPARSRSRRPISAGARRAEPRPRAQRRGGGGATGGRRLKAPARDEPEGGGVGPARRAGRPRCPPRLPACDLAAPPPQVKGPCRRRSCAPGAAPGQPVLVHLFSLCRNGERRDVCAQNSRVRARPRVASRRNRGARVAGVISAGWGHSWPCPLGENLDARLEMMRKGCVMI